MDLPEGSIKEVEMLDHECIVAYYGEYCVKSKTYKTMGGQSEVFKDFSMLFVMVAMLHQDAYAMSSKAIELSGWSGQRRASFGK